MSSASLKDNWRCPVCEHSLTYQERVWACENHHQFDIAKEGYVNLLLANQKNSKEPGDSKEMVLARQIFLASGAYQPLVQELSDIILSSVSSNSQKKREQASTSLVDVGCCEGYYSAFIAEQFEKTNLALHVSGFDIAKPAVQKAAKQHKSHQYAVASSYNVPLHTDSQDIALQVFAPASSEEIKRILKPSGFWLKVDPAPNHLFELKQHVYDKPQHHSENNEVPEGFILEDSIRLSFTCELIDEEMRVNLLKMTPFYWRIDEDNKHSLINDLRIVSADFLIKKFRLV